MNAPIYEIFNSIQGEGIYAGIRQVFVRFYGCQLTCEYCDTGDARSAAGGHSLDVDAAIAAIDDLWTPATRSVSLTGGEPLLHHGFIKELARATSRSLYLETNAGFPEYARGIADLIDTAACDVKLPEHRSTDDYGSLLDAELKTIGIFHADGVETFVKIVVLPQTTERSIEDAVFGIRSIDDTIPLVLQPATPGKIDLQQLLGLIDFAGTHLSDVRVIPQMHKLIGIP